MRIQLMGGPLDGAQLEVHNFTPGLRVPIGEPVKTELFGEPLELPRPRELVYQDCGLKTRLTGDRAFAYRGIL